DVRQAIGAIRDSAPFATSKIELEASGPMAGVVLYASLFDAPVDRLRLDDLPANHNEGPYLLSIDQVLDLPQTLAMARDRTTVILEISGSVGAWSDNLRQNLASSSQDAPLKRLKRY